MAKNTQLSLDNYDFGSEFDFDEFDFTPKPVKNKREAVERIAGGMLEGAKDTLKSPSFFRDLIRKALPRGYGDMLDLLDNGVSTTRELYHEGAKEAKPALKEVAQVVDKLMPNGSKYAPKAVNDAMKKFTEAYKDKSQVGFGHEGTTDLSVAAMLSDTFRHTEKREQYQKAREEARQGIQDVIDNHRHQDNVIQLDGIRRAVTSMSAYQRKIEFGYQKKSLELQARSYFVQVDLLNETKRQNVHTAEMMQGILRNTSLPDVVKMKASERFTDMMRTKVFNGLQDGIFGQRANFMQNVGKAFRDQFMGSLRSMAEGVRDGASGMENASDMTQTAEEMGMDRYRLMGNMAGGQMASWAGKLGASRIGQKIMGPNPGRAGKAIRRLGNRMQFGVDNAPQIATDFSHSARDGQSYLEQLLGDRFSDRTRENISGVGGKILDPMIDLLRGTVRRANAADTKVNGMNLRDMHAPALFNNQAHKSLVEVIPGYLARIYQELQITRTGDTQIDLVQYDFSRGNFGKTKAVRKSLFNQLFDQNSKDGVKREQDQLLAMIDPDGTKLNPAQRAELAKILMNDNMRGRAGYETGRISNYTNADAFGESSYGEQYAELFKKLAGRDAADGEHKVAMEFAQKFRTVGRSMTDRRDDIQRILEIFPRDTLEDMGIIKPGSGEIDMAKVSQYFGGENYQASGIMAEGGLRQIGGGKINKVVNRITSSNSNTQTDSNGLADEIRKLMGLLERQNTQPLVSEIRDILLAMQAQAGQPGQPDQPGDPAGPSSLDRVAELMGNAGSQAARAAQRARRKVFVEAGRLRQRHQDTIDNVRNRAGELYADASERGRDLFSEGSRQARRLKRETLVRAGRLRQRHQGTADGFLESVQERFGNRPTPDQIQEILQAQLSSVRQKAGNAFQNLRSHGASVGGQIHQGVNAARRRLEESEFSDSNSVLVEMRDTLLAIRDKLDDGLVVTQMDGRIARAIQAAKNTGGSAKRGLNRLNLSISQLVGGTFRLGGKAIGMAGRGVGSLVKGGVNTAWNLGKGTVGLAAEGASFAMGSQWRRTRGFVDIYVGNERKPRLYGRMLQEGNIYFDKETNKPIQRLKDITGAVVKRTAAGDETVLEANEVEAAWQRVGPIKKTLKALGVIVKGAYGVTKNLAGAVLGAIPPVLRMAFRGVKKVWGLLDMAQDIYLTDQLDNPVMTARVMRAGGYVSAVSGKIITKPSMIDGPVLIGDEVVLTHDDLRKGLVDKNNKPIRSGFLKLINWTGKGLNAAGKLAWKAGKLVNKAATGLVDNAWKLGGKATRGVISVGGGTMDLLRGRNPLKRGTPEEQQLQVTNKANTLLEEIRDILKDRLSKRKKVAGDVDGDGDRDGSYADLMQRQASQQAQTQVGGTPSAPRAGVTGADRREDEEEDGDINIELGEIGPDGKRQRRPRVRRGTSWRNSRGFKAKAKFLGKAAMRGLGAVGRGALGLAGVGGGALAAAGGGIMGGLSAVGGVIGAGATAIAGAISLPVVLGAAAVAAAGVGAYHGYKYLTRKKLGLLSRVRYAQYGFFPTDTDHIGPVFSLEDKLKTAIIYGKDGAKLDAKRVDPMELIKDFGFDADDTKELNNWLSWFSTRFKPVFLTHVSALKGIAGDKWLADVDDLEPAIGLTYLEATRYPEGPYSASASPFKDLKSLPAGASDVKGVIKTAEEELRKKTKGSPKVVGVTTGAVAVTATTTTVTNTPPAMQAQVGFSGIDPKVLTGAVVTAAAAPAAMTGGQVTVSGSNAALQHLGVDRLDGLDVVRMKSYGLVRMELDKVKALLSLEKMVAKNLRFQKNVASWNGSLEEVMVEQGAAFGVDVSDAATAANWLSWFSQRFLPVYLNYSTLIKAQTGKDNPEEGKVLLKAAQTVDVATAVFTTTGVAGSVWNVSTSPWLDYQLNVDVRSTDANVQGLKDMAKNTVLTEPGANVANQPSAKKGAVSPQMESKPFVGGVVGGAWSAMKSAGQGVKNAAVGVVNWFKGPQAGTGVANGPSTMTGGNEVIHPGKGTGGDVNSIPKPTGNRTWESVKDTIVAAAKMVGVDWKLMARIAAVESGFNHGVKALGSSATGLFQFIKSTWNTMIAKFGPKYGIAPGTPPTDARANALMGAEYIKWNMQALDGKMGRPVADTDVYMAHFLGSGGASKFFRQDPNAIASVVMPKEAASNPGIFYDSQRNPRTFGQIYQLMNDKLHNKSKKFGVDGGSEEIITQPVAKPTAVPAATATATSAVAVKKEVVKGPSTSAFAVGTTVDTKPSAAIPAQAPAGPTNHGVPIGIVSAGFMPPRPLQDQYNAVKQQSEVRVSNLEGTNAILTQSHETQKGILSAVQDLTKAVTATMQPTKEATKTSQAARVTPPRSSEMPKMPVSVARPPRPY